MGHNVQSQAGVSLSDVYDVKGGQAPIERLLTTEVPVVHEMGETIFSERCSQFIRESQQTVSQSTVINIVMDDLPGGISRISGVSVNVDTATASDFDRMAVSLEDTTGGRAIPIWVYDEVNIDEIRILFDGTVGGDSYLRPRPEWTTVPNLITSPEQPQTVANIACRGLTSGYGAGTRTIKLRVFLTFAAIGGISSRGLPIPSW